MDEPQKPRVKGHGLETPSSGRKLVVPKSWKLVLSTVPSRGLLCDSIYETRTNTCAELCCWEVAEVDTVKRNCLINTLGLYLELREMFCT